VAGRAVVPAWRRHLIVVRHRMPVGRIHGSRRLRYRVGGRATGRAAN
jgi:hypothetical protein